MDFILGIILTFLILFMISAYRYIKKYEVNSLFSIRYSQSHIHQLIKPLIPEINISINSKTKRQSINHLNTNHIKVIINKNMAYWIKNNVFYTAEVIDGQIDKDNARVVDTMSMDKVELDKMMFIIDQLRKDDEA